MFWALENQRRLSKKKNRAIEEETFGYFAILSKRDFMIRKNKKLEKKFNSQEELLNIVEKYRNEIIQRGADWVYQESFDLKDRQPKEETKKLVAKLITML